MSLTLKLYQEAAHGGITGMKRKIIWLSTLLLTTGTVFASDSKGDVFAQDRDQSLILQSENQEVFEIAAAQQPVKAKLGGVKGVLSFFTKGVKAAADLSEKVVKIPKLALNAILPGSEGYEEGILEETSDGDKISMAPNTDLALNVQSKAYSVLDFERAEFLVAQKTFEDYEQPADGKKRLKRNLLKIQVLIQDIGFSKDDSK